MTYILKGDPKEVAKVLRENRIRVDRGVIEFTPCQQDSALDADSIATLREALEASEKSCQVMAEGHVELAGITRDIIAIIAENRISVPEDLTERLAQFGIDVPKIADPVVIPPQSAPTADAPQAPAEETVTAGAAAPEQPEAAPAAEAEPVQENSNEA